jgi:hypothetical protein
MIFINFSFFRKKAPCLENAAMYFAHAYDML